MSTAICIDSVSKVFGDGTKRVVALEDVSLTVEGGEFVVLLGPSGCGKSTLLRMIAGLSDVSSGGIWIGGRPVVGRDPEVGMVFQSYTSFPWLSVRDNIEFGLKLAGVDRGRRRTTSDRILEAVSLEHVADAYPSQLSGGMQQRVAIGRTLAIEPTIQLMDEPFGALDAMTRLEMQTFLVDLWSRDRKTVVFVTHDIDEAILLADRIVVLSANPGRVSEIVPVNIERPRSLEKTESDTFLALRRSLRESILAMRSQVAA